VLDRADKHSSHGARGSAEALAAAAISVWIDHPHGIEHNKIIVIDDDLVIDGSYNFTGAAQYRNVART
jgi:phosphatidylserine/phosphatidylglycerophosphate/cardiolipin synthase-like enzyme